MKKIGLIVNPVAGIGGKVGLKGSDGEETYRRAVELGAVMESGQKALIAVRLLKGAEDEIKICTCPGKMGEDVCKAADLSYSIPRVLESGKKTNGGDTTSEDTICAAKAFLDESVDLILFAGGDGTARDIMDAVGTAAPAVGIPSGCKIHSGVYALNPRSAGELAVRYIRGKVYGVREAEVMDIDEEQFREGRVQSRLYGYLMIPDETRLLQNRKSGSRYGERESIERLSDYIADTWEPETLYIVGSGSTTACVMRKKNLPNTLLGIDLVYEDQLIASDCTEKEILHIMKRYEKIKILVTVIGGQGFIFGRGNQQVSAEVIRRVGKENIIVAASPDKMSGFFGKSLYADTGDEETDRYLAGYMRVIVGYGEYVMMKIS